ncbi:hypothetical protein BJ508DRAFT_335660 [Ascobolus immersus RN42]|uniref:Uncharacterized protein n=1 Tax=Ascobolus immersus RN42 TaxID=1160509 RepID=A0A3N4HG32_ASCIM|nr:hypothetical protein BJ508DRAFT_335660 [Ascobolus immersus RN42]
MAERFVELQRRIDENLWKSLSMLSEIFPGKELPVYRNMARDYGNELMGILYGLHSFSGLLVRDKRTVATSVMERTVNGLKLLVCRTNDGRDSGSDRAAKARKEDTLCGKDKQDGYAQTSSDILYQLVVDPKIPRKMKGDKDWDYLLAVRWDMEWEEHVAYLTYYLRLIVQSNTEATRGTFIRYCLLSRIPQNNVRLCKTPLQKRHISFFDIIRSISPTDVKKYPPRAIPNLYKDPRVIEHTTVRNFLNDEDVRRLGELLKKGPFASLPLELLPLIIERNSLVSMGLIPSHQALLCSELWTIIQQCLETTRCVYSKILAVPAQKVTAKLVKRTINNILIVFDFMNYCLHESQWLRWLMMEHSHVAFLLANPIRKLLARHPDELAGNGATEEPDLDDGEDCELNDSGGHGFSDAVLAFKVLSYLKLSFSTKGQAEEVMQYAKLFTNLEVTIVSSVSSEADELWPSWEETIIRAYQLAHPERPDLAKEGSDAVLDKIREVYDTGSGDDKERLAFADPEAKWAFNGSVHCESVLAGEYLKQAKHRAKTARRPPIFYHISTLIGPSKRCCPLCVIIATAVSRESIPHISILCQHSTPLASALPPNLPRSVRKRALEELAGNLCRALDCWVVRMENQSLERRLAERKGAGRTMEEMYEPVNWDDLDDDGDF